MGELETVEVVYQREVVPCEIARGKKGGILKQLVAKLLNLQLRQFALDLQNVPALKERYGTADLVEGKTVLDPAIPLDEHFFKECDAASKRKEYILVIDIPGSAPQALVPQFPVPPSPFDGTLYEASDAAVQIYTAFLRTSGVTTVPVLPHAFGAGKTTICMRFREYSGHPDVQALLLDDAKRRRFQEINEARYFYVLVKDNGTSLFGGTVESVLAAKIWACVKGHARPGDYAGPPEDGHELATRLSAMYPGVRILFHFDEVQNLELRGVSEKEKVGMYYGLWNFAEELAGAGRHLYMFSGRSRYLSRIGQTKHGQIWSDLLRPSDASSPGDTLVIDSLVLFRMETIAQKYTDSGLRCWAACADALDLVCAFSAGVPRLVQDSINFLVTQFKCTAEANSWLERVSREGRVHEEVEALFRSEQCLDVIGRDGGEIRSGTASSSKEEMATLFELALTKTPVNLRSKLLGRVASESIGWAGFYADGVPEAATIRMPLWHYKRHYPELAFMFEWPDAGQRLEGAFPKLMKLRQTVKPDAECWEDYLLPVLDAAGFPFPASWDHSPVPLPKLTKNKGGHGGPPSKEDSKALTLFFEQWYEADKALRHSRSYTFPKMRTDFPRSMRRLVYERMPPGVLLKHLAKSKSQDFSLRYEAEVPTVLAVQLKNKKDPYDIAKVAAEYDKARVDGWRVLFVLICLSGSNAAGDVIQEVHDGSGSVIVVPSAESVQRFFGRGLVQGVISRSSMPEEVRSAGPAVQPANALRTPQKQARP